MVNKARDAAIAARYRGGDTLAGIGVDYSLTKQRIQQILARQGVSSACGGRGLRSATAREAERAQGARLDAMCLRIYGVGLATFREITGNSKWPRRADPASKPYLQQKRTARARSIEWRFTLSSWWAVWQESGRWKERGRGDGYCMARHGDVGPYSPENVYICTTGQNFRDSYVWKPAKTRRRFTGRQNGA